MYTGTTSILPTLGYTTTTPDYLVYIDRIRVWTLGPEREGILRFVQDAKRANPGVVFTVGHSAASPAQIEALIPYGLCIGTHHTNATGDLPKYPECRGVCVDETVNFNNGIYAELISDSCGIHVDPYMQRLIRKIKTDDKIILITDHTAYPAMKPEGYEHVTDLIFTDIKMNVSTVIINGEVVRNEEHV